MTKIKGTHGHGMSFESKIKLENKYHKISQKNKTKYSKLNITTIILKSSYTILIHNILVSIQITKHTDNISHNRIEQNCKFYN